MEGGSGEQWEIIYGLKFKAIESGEKVKMVSSNVTWQERKGAQKNSKLSNDVSTVVFCKNAFGGSQS